MSRYSNTLRVVILTDSGNKIVAPLLHQGLHIVGVSEIHDEFGALSKSRQWLERLYWLIYKRQNMPGTIISPTLKKKREAKQVIFSG